MMIVTEQRRKSRLSTALKRVAAATILLFAGIHAPWSAETGPTPYWYDEETGIAIGGFDPLSYVIYGQPRLGDPDNEYALDGLTWRFVNPGNRDAFGADANVYAPAFGGYDVIGVARGVLSQGNPRIWLHHEDQLLFFFSMTHKALFEQNKAGYFAKARQNWPKLARSAPRWPGQSPPNG